MSQNVQFTTKPPEQSPVCLKLMDYPNGEVDLFATDNIGNQHRLGIFKNGRLGLIYICDDAKRALGIQTDPTTGCLAVVPISS